MTTSMTKNINNLIPVSLVSDADRLAISEDNVLYMHMLRAKLESDIADMNMDFEDSTSVQSHKSRNLSRKERARRHRKANRTHKIRDRYHGKKGEEYRYAEGACRDMRLYNGGLVYDRNIRRERLETARINSALDISPVERLTASVLAHMSNHVFMWDEQLVYDLTEAICEEYKQPYPDDSYIVKAGAGIVHLIFQVERFRPGYGPYIEETDYRLN